MRDISEATIPVRCECGERFRVAAAMQGMTVRCRRCRQMVAVPRRDAPDADAPLHDAADGRPRLEVVKPIKCYQCHAVMPPDIEACPRCGYNRFTRSFVPAEEYLIPERPVEPSVGNRTFWMDALASFFVFTDSDNMVTLLFVALIALVGAVGGWFHFGIMIIVNGWLFAYYISVLEHTAGDDEDLPALTLIDGWLDGIVRPCVFFIGSWLGVFLPAIVFGLFARVGLGDFVNAILAGHISVRLWILAGLFAFGTFCWPAAILLMCTTSGFMVLRVDLWVRAVLQGFNAYLLMWFILFLVVVAQFAIGMVVGGAFAITGRTALRVGLFGAVISAYGWVVSMRIIGLYYVHFKDRLPWRAE